MYTVQPFALRSLTSASCLIKFVPYFPLACSWVRPLPDSWRSHLWHCGATIRTVTADVSPLAHLCSTSDLFSLLSGFAVTSLSVQDDIPALAAEAFRSTTLEMLTADSQHCTYCRNEIYIRFCTGWNHESQLHWAVC